MITAMENWNSAAAYDRYAGRWSRLVGEAFVAWLGLPAGLDWADVGCGTGVLCQAIVRGAAPASLVGVDKSDSFLALANERLAGHTVRFERGEGLSLPIGDATVDAAVSGLMLNFIPDHTGVVAEMRRIARLGGTVGVYVWDYADGMQMMRQFWDAARQVDPAAERWDQGQRFAICDPEALSRLFAAAGLEDVEVSAIEVPTPFQDFDDFWQPFLGGQGGAPAYCGSLQAETRDRLRQVLSERLPIEPDGSIHLTARAWAVRGRV
ncbi:MAG: methyltransferase domain-containing protein [Pseudomonadota bacterium]